MGGELVVDAEIVEEDAHELAEVCLECPNDDSLVCSGGIGQAERHDDPKVGTPFGDEGGLLLVGWRNANLVVSALTIHK